MLISFSTLVLASQLIVTVADNVPKFNIERGCKVDARGRRRGYSNAARVGMGRAGVFNVPKPEKAEVLAAFAAHKDEVTAGYVAAAKRG